MKKFLLFILCLFSGLALASCGGEEAPIIPDKPDTPDEEKPEELTPTDENIGFAIHYNLTTKIDDKYKFNLWVWEVGKDGADYQFTSTSSFGIVARFKWTSFSSQAEQNGVGFIVKENKVWSESPSKDTDNDRFIDFSGLERDKYGYYNIYLKNNDPEIYISESGDVSEIVQYFSIAYNQVTGFRLWFQTNKPYESFNIKLGDETVFSNTELDDRYSTKTDKKVIIDLGKTIPEITEDYTLDLVFKSGKSATKVADKSVLYTTAEFEAAYTYDGELGAIFAPQATTFRVWSPISKTIKLRVYNNGTPASLGGDDEYKEYPMISGEKGTWEATVQGNIAGKYYTYVVTNSSFADAEIVDPYAKSTGVNGLRGMVVDFSLTNPTGWNEVEVNNYASTELTVYETHIADLTSSDTWGGTEANAKLFKGFYETGTKYTKDGVTVSTGFDHIKELGVNAVQIIPIFDQANDEREEHREFNWGYNPLNYNALDGIFSSNPNDGYEKIKEFKALVQAYNNAGINIIMDVVYNHVAGLEKSNFDVLMPKYYFRYTSAGASNGSGCGNETASEMKMFRKFMIDSTEFWASEYKLGGFRFDLMGIHDVQTMNDLSNNLHEKVNPAITVYGEPWAGGTIALAGGHKAANQTAMNSFEGYGCFNDKLRDALIKGGLNSVDTTGWITNNKSASIADIDDIKAGIKGLVLADNSIIEPEKCVNYVTCHDNYTLYDRIKAAGITDETTIKQMAMLSNSVVFTTQGISFMLAGEEFLRTKQGNENSYNASYEINQLDYSLKIKHLDMFENYQKLIALKQNSALFGKNGTDAKNIVIEVSDENNLIIYDLVDSVNNRTYRIIHSNGVSGTKTANLDGYTLYLDTLNKTNMALSSQTAISNYQTIIAYKSLS